MNSPAEIDSQVAGIPSPGTLLGARREEYGWSVKDVAAAMRLSERQVEAIEADEYAALPGKTYIMGYWRSYSQLLRLPIDESIQIHRADLSSGVREISLEPSHQQVRGSEEKSRKRAALLFAGLLAIFLGAVWYWQDPDASLGEWVGAGLGSLTGSGGTETGAGAGTEVATEVVPQPVTPLVVAESVLALPEPNFSEGQESVVINTRGYEVLVAELPLSRRDLVYQPWPEQPAGAEGTGPVTDATPVVAATEDTVTEAEKAAILAAAAAKAAEARRVREAEAARAEQEAAAASAQQAASAPGRQISFRVEKESWLDVRDKTGERLIYRTVNSGEDIQLNGTPPYSVFIGSADGVVVQYQGQAVPIRVHESGLFARFEVGQP